MNRKVTPLLIVLLIQCVLIAALYWSETGIIEQNVRLPLSPFDPDSIDQLRIGDEYDNQAVLRKSGDHWLLPDLENLPADPLKVQKLIDTVSDQDLVWPIAHTVAARQRFQVANYYYQRRIKLLAGDQPLGTIYLGTSPGFRKVHARNEAQNSIYSLTMNVIDAPGNSAGWLDRSLLQIRTPLSISADSYSLRREGNDWRSGIGKVPDERELLALLSALRSLQVEGVADQDIQRDLAAMEADLVLEVHSLAGQVTLELFQHGRQHFIHSSEYPLFFTLGAYDYDRLTGIDFRLISGEQPGA